MENEYVYDYESICEFNYSDDITSAFASISTCYENGEPNNKYRYVYDIEIFNPTTLQTVAHTRAENLYNLELCKHMFTSFVSNYIKPESKVN